MNRRVASSELTIVGAGLLGLATTVRLAERRPDLRILVVEKEAGIARHQSGHNSGVVHAGLYYVPGSLKASLCRAGAAALRERCERWGVPVVPRGKLVVAVGENELPRLEELERRGRENGIQGMTVLGQDELREIEPSARGVRALHVPETSVVDFKLVAAKLEGDLREHGVEWTMSRISCYNPRSLASHARLGAVALGEGTFLCFGRVQIAMLSLPPYLFFSLRPGSMPRIVLQAPRNR